MSKQRRIETQLFLAQQDVDAALVLAASNNRYAAFHCQQASEKLIKALLDHRGIEFGAEHHLDVRRVRGGAGRQGGVFQANLLY
jgi:HEPN domain-containing protein